MMKSETNRAMPAKGQQQVAEDADELLEAGALVLDDLSLVQHHRFFGNGLFDRRDHLFDGGPWGPAHVDGVDLAVLAVELLRESGSRR